MFLPKPNHQQKYIPKPQITQFVLNQVDMLLFVLMYRIIQLDDGMSFGFPGKYVSESQHLHLCMTVMFMFSAGM